MRNPLGLWSLGLFVGLALVSMHALPWKSAGAGRVAADSDVSDSAPLDAVSVIHMYCAGCHSSGRARVDLDGPVDRGELRRERATWEEVLRKLHGASPGIWPSEHSP